MMQPSDYPKSRRQIRLERLAALKNAGRPYVPAILAEHAVTPIVITTMKQV